MLSHRLAALKNRQCQADLDGIILVPGPNMVYVSGMHLHISERPIVLFLPTADRLPVALLPAFERGNAARALGGQTEWVTYTDEEGYVGAFGRAAQVLGLDGQRFAVEDLHMRALELWQLQAAAPNAQFVSLEQTLPGLRIYKDDTEISAMRKAIEITEGALHTLISQPLAGLSERQVAQRLSQLMREGGAQAIAFIIVVAGPNSADPHAVPSDRLIQAGDMLTIDCGVICDGYPADITRTFAIGEVDDQLHTIYETVKAANAAGKAAVRPGVSAQEVDRAVRQVIVNAGYGDYFTHRTGHGLGIEVHEPPYIVEGNAQILKPGMVFTVEPGIYVPGLGGVRVEDDVLVTEQGMDCLTTFARTWTVLPTT